MVIIYWSTKLEVQAGALDDGGPALYQSEAGPLASSFTNLLLIYSAGEGPKSGSQRGPLIVGAVQQR